MTTNLRILIPLYNEEAVLEKFFDSLTEALLGLDGATWSVLFLVDKSSDDTEKIVERLVAKNVSVEAIIFANRAGHQNALLAGIENSLSYDALIMMDADLQHPPSLIPGMIKLHQTGFEIVNTKRIENADNSVLREWAGRIFYLVFKRISGIELEVNSADFRLISKRIANLIATQFPERLMFLRGLFAWIGVRSASISYEAAERAGGRSKYSLKGSIRFAWEGIVSFSTAPLLVSIYIGVFLALFALGIGAYFIICYFVVNQTPSGWTTLATLLAFFCAMQLLAIGVLGLYVIRVYHEVKGRPRYIIEREYKHEK